MSQLLSQKKAVALLTEHGWERTTGGKHVVKMVKPGKRPITLPHHHGQPYSRGLTQAILRQAGIDKEDGGWSSPSRSAPSPRGTGPRSPSSRDALPPPER